MSTEYKKDVVSNQNDERENLQVGEVVAKTEEFINKNKKSILITLAAVIVVIVGVCVYFLGIVPSKEKKAANAMFAAEQYYMQDDYEKALKGDGKHQGFLAISEDYSSTKQGKLAKYYIGNIYLNQGKFQQAVEYLKGFSPDDAFMEAQAKTQLADAYVELNQLDKAISNYEKAASIKPNDFNTPAILMKLGTAYEMKKDFKKALDCYKTIKSDYPASQEYATIEKYISRMNSLLEK